jgi:hypothetical protein
VWVADVCVVAVLTLHGTHDRSFNHAIAFFRVSGLGLGRVFHYSLTVYWEMHDLLHKCHVRVIQINNESCVGVHHTILHIRQVACG